MDAKERLKAWKELPEPKPSWESFKVMLRNFNNVAKAHEAFLEKERKRQAQENSNHGQDL